MGESISGHEGSAAPAPADDARASVDAEVRRFIDASVLCWLATVDPDGTPNVSPKEIFCASGDSELLIAHIASPNSVHNIRRNPMVCVSFVDVFVQKGFKLKGRATVVDKGEPGYDALAAPLLAMTRGVFPILSVIRIEVRSAALIVAPSYRMVPGTTEQSQAEGARAAYRWPRT